MNKAHLLIKNYFGIIFMILFTGCSTTVPSPTSTSEPTFTSIPPTLTPTATETPALTLTPTLTPLPSFSLDGYVVIFIKDNDLYFQDENHAPAKLAHIGQLSSGPKFSDNTGLSSFSPILSDDNQKVLFSRSDGNIYSINTNGTQERIIIPKNWLGSFKTDTKIGILNFVPGSHELFIETNLCIANRPPCSNTLFLANTDTGEIRKLGEFSLNSHSYGKVPQNIAVSPNGKMLAIGTPDGLDILTLDGKIIRNNILPYTPDSLSVSFPTLSWLPDSSGLIVALPNTTYSTNCNDFTAHTIWRYTISSNTTIQIPLDPPPMDTFISPDGNWVVYSNFCQSSLYRGNLTNGQVAVFGEEENHPTFYWSSDSKYLIYFSNLVISFDKPPISGKVSPRWIDANHFLYFESTEPESRSLLGEIGEQEIHSFSLPFPHASFFMIRLKQ